MVQIIQENKKPTFSQKLNIGLGRGLETGSQLFAQHKQEQMKEQQKKAVSSLMGNEIANLPENLQKLFVDYTLKGQNEQALNAQKLAWNNQKLRAIETERGLEPGSLQAYESDPAMAERITKPSKPVTGSEPVPKNISQSIKKVLSNNPNANADELRIAMDEEGIPPTYSNPYTENRRRMEESSPETLREKQIATAQASSDVKYISDLNQSRSKQILKKSSLDRLKAMSKKKATGKAYEKFLENMGLTALTSEGRREFAAEVKNQFTDFKQIAGSQLSAQEFFILAGAYPNPDFSPEANEAIIKNLEDVHDTLDKELEISQKLIKENKGKIPDNVQQKVNNELQDYVSNKTEKMKDRIKLIMNEQYGIPKGFTLMFDKDGEPLSVPEHEVVRLLEENLADLP